jgi:CRP-like cAMP-binding protein
MRGTPDVETNDGGIFVTAEADRLVGVEVARTRILSGLSPQVQREILAAAFTKNLGAREPLANEGEAATTFYLVVVGHLKLSQTAPDGREVIARFIGPGDPYAGVVLLNHPVYPVSAIAVEPSRVLGWPRAVINDLAARHPPLRVNVLEEITRHMTDALDRVSELTTERVPQRVARTLLRLAEHDGHVVGTGIEIAHPVTRQELADLVGTTLFTVSRLLASWEQQGLIHSARGHVTVLKPRALKALTESPDGGSGALPEH